MHDQQLVTSEQREHVLEQVGAMMMTDAIQGPTVPQASDSAVL